MSFSLRRRLMVLLVGGFTGTIGLGAAMIYKATLHEADEIFDYHMEEIADIVAATGVPPPPGNSAPQTADRVEERLDVLVRIESPQGDVLHDSGWPPRAPAVVGFHDFTSNGTPYRLYGRVTPERVVRMAQDASARRALARNLALEALAPFLLLAPLLVAAAWWLVRRSLAPIDRTRAQIATRPASDMTPLPTQGLPDEVSPLVGELNLLFARVRGAFDAQSAFIADAAHELRSPLAALRVQAQGVQKAASPEAREVAVRRLLAGMDRATRLVEQMLALARQEASAGSANPSQPVDLRGLARDVVTDLVALATEKDIDLGVADGAEVSVAGRSGALRILLQNLVDNAIKYTPAGGTIDISMGSTNGRTWVAVEDSGPGIAPGERERVFDRFFRVAGHDATGSGLGLAIVRKVAESHQAEIVLDTSPALRGLRVQVTFPP